MIFFTEAWRRYNVKTELQTGHILKPEPTDLGLPLPGTKSGEIVSLETSHESRKRLIFSTQLHRVLISSPLSLSQNECETL